VVVSYSNVLDVVNIKFNKMREQVNGLVSKKCNEQALLLARAYCRRNRKDYNGWLFYGGLLGRLEHYIQAGEAYRHAIKLQPEDPEGWFGVAKADLKLGRYALAIEGYSRVVELNPGDYEAWFDMGNARRILGDKSGAIKDLRQSIDIQPDYADAYFALSGLKKFATEDPEIKVMANLLKSQQMSDSDRIALCFTLAKAYDDIQDYAAAFTYLEAGNKLERSRYRYDIKNDVRLISAIKGLFNSAYLDRYRDIGSTDTTPVFIVGMPRSGTTLVEQIISSHPVVYGAGELRDLSEIILSVCANNSAMAFPESAIGLDASCFPEMADRYLTRIHDLSNGAQIVIDKNPANFLLIGFIYIMFPNAKVIHCRRNPMDTCLSIYQQYFSGPRAYAYNLEELGHYYRLYQGLMTHWHNLLPGFICDVDYEVLVSDQRAITQELLAFCGLGWDETCMAFFKSDRPVETSSVEQVRRPIYHTSVSKAQHYHNQLKPLIDILSVAHE